MGASSERRSRGIKITAIASAALLAAVLVACGQPQTVSSSSAAATATTTNAKTDITTADNTVVVTAEEWAGIYPNECATIKLNEDDSETSSYLKANPFLATIYEGSAFAKQYDVARGHPYTITDVQATARIGEKTKATCYACKGSYYPVADLEQTDGSLYTTPFADVDSSKLAAISCYDCHLNNPAGVVSARQFFNKAFPNATIDWGASAAACGQCHNEYYFDQTTKAVTVPAGLTDATAMLDFYNSIHYVDHTNPRTGVEQLKAQHPEVQTFAGSIHQKAGLSCADCHMERLVDDKGNAYTSHQIVNPLESETIQNNVCARCHSDVSAQLQLEQKMATAECDRETKVGEELEALTNKLADAVASGNYTDMELSTIRDLNRSAMWYWDYVFVENSNGFHNNEQAQSNLDLAESYCNQAMVLLNK